MNRLEVLGFKCVGMDPGVGIEAGGDVADQVFDKFGVVIGPLSDEFFVRTFDQAEDFTGGLFFHDVDQILDP